MIPFFKRYQKEIAAVILVSLFQSFVFEVFVAYANPLPQQQVAYLYPPVLDGEEYERINQQYSTVNSTTENNFDQKEQVVDSYEIDLADAMAMEEASKQAEISQATGTASPTVHSKDNESATLYTADLVYGVIGVDETVPYDNPEDNVFRVNITEAIDAQATYVLSYELYGASSAAEVAKSINTTTSVGGYLKSKTTTWTRVEEYLSASNLKQGINTVLFTADQRAGSQYLVRHLQIEKRVAADATALLQLNTTVRDSITGKVYVSGIVSSNLSENESELYISGKRIPITHRRFEYIENSSPEVVTPLVVELKKEDQLLEKQTVVLSESKALPEVKELTTPFQRYEFDVQKAKEVREITASRAGILLPEGSSKADFTLSIQELRPSDYAPTGMAMINVTANKSAYRFLPDGIQFEQEVTLLLPYDVAALPRGYSAKDIQVFYFDTQMKQWEKVKVIDVLEESQQVVAVTTHFTDYLAGVIQEPESPEGEAFAPTTLNGIQAVNPTENIPMISVPQINDRGDAALTFPLMLPQGRQGVTPDISVNYNSGSDEGDFGLGWSLSVPTISIDTRWGVPLYDTAKETESYLLNGEELLLVKADRTLYVPHKDPLINRVSNAVFQKAQHNPNLEIKRLGPVNNYTWQVIDHTTGWIYLYDLYSKGKWYLTRVKDPFENFMQYYYERNSNGDYQLGKIIYNRHPSVDLTVNNIPQTTSIIQPRVALDSHVFIIDVFRKKTIDLPAGTRIDIKTNNRFGEESKSVDLIDRIVVRTEPIATSINVGNENISIGYAFNEYKFLYKKGQFGRSLLYKIVNTNSNNNYEVSNNNYIPNIQEYNLDYYDDIGSGPLFESAGQTINTYKDYATEYDSFGVNISALGGSEGKSTNFNGGGSAGIVTPIFPNSWLPFSRAATLGGNFGGGSSNTEIKVMMTDIDGDGLPDKVFKDSNKFYYRKNLGTAFSTEIYPIKDLPNLSYSRGENSDESFSLNIFVGNITRSNSKSSSKTSSYMTDVNADGLLDIVDNERVYFGYIDPQTKAPSYSLDSSITPVIVLKEEDVAPILNPEPQVDLTNGPMDMVMVWRAPKPGQVKVTGTISKQHVGLENGVKFSIERLNASNEMGTASFILGPNLMLSTSETHNHTLTVEKGDLLFFRTHTNQIPQEELGVSWNPKVEYIGVNPDPILTSSRHTSTYRESFIVGTNQEHVFDKKGKYRLEWPSFDIHERDRITIQVSYFKKGSTAGGNLPIIGNNVLIYNKASGINNTTTMTSPNQVLDMSSITSVPSSFHYIKVEVQSDSEINWKAIDNVFKPKLVSLDSSNPDIYLIPYYTNYSKVHTSNTPLQYIATGPRVTVTINNNFSIPGCTSAVCENRYIYLVARYDTGQIMSLVSNSNPNEFRGYVKFRYKFNAAGVIVQKQRLNANYIYENLDNSYSFTLSPSIGEKYFFEYYTTEHEIGKLLDDYQGYSGSNPPPFLIKATSSGNPSTYMAGVDTNGKVKANIYTSESTIAWGPMFRNWGQFAYKGADVGQAYQPIVGKNIQFFNNTSNTTSSGATAQDVLNDPNLTLDQAELEMDEIQDLGGNMSEYFAMLLPNKQLNRWESHEHLYVSSSIISPYTRFLTDDIPDLRPPTVPVGNFGAVGINKYSYFKNNTTNKSLGFLGLSFGRAKTDGSSELLNEFMDINGDGFPDIIGERIQITAKRGGLSSRIVQADFTVRSSISGSGTLAGGGNAGMSGSPKLGDRATRAANFMANLNTKIGNQASGALNGSKFTTNNTANRFYVDINGDGLIDIVQSNGKVLLNYGGVFRESTIWQSLPLQKSKSETIGGSGNGASSLGFSSQSNLDISAGLSISSSTSKDEITYLDLNGDGLPEKIQSGKYYINTGIGFETTGYNLPGSQTQKSIEAGLNGNVTVCVYFPLPFILTGPKFCASVGAATGRNVSSEESRYMDFDGDGFVDYVTSTKNESITVYKSRIKRTNLLKAVTQTTGAKIELDYDIVNPIDQSPIGSTYKMPYKKWALTKVAVYDGFEGDGQNTTRYAYEYFNGYKDRKERNFFGFGKTQAHLLNTDGVPFRTEVTEYLLNGMNDYELYQPGTSSGLKQYLYKKGLPKKTYTLDKRKRLLTETTFDYKFYDTRLLTADVNTATTSSAEVGTFTEKLSVLPLVTSMLTKNWTYQEETGTTALMNQTQQKFELYDKMGNVKKYVDVDRGVTMDITYNLGIRTLPISHKVSLTVGGQQLRLTNASVTTNGVQYSEVKKYSSSSTFSSIKYEYDLFGNLTKKTLPGGFVYKYNYSLTSTTGTSANEANYFRIYPGVITDPFGNITTVYHSAFGQPVLVRDVYGEEMRYKYDPFNRLLEAKGPYETDWTIKNTYVSNRKAITQHNLGNGNILHTSMLTDGLGRLIQVKKQLANDEGYLGCGGRTPALRLAVSGRTKYDEFGRVVENYLSEEELYCDPLRPQQTLASILTTYYQTTDLEERKIMTTYDDQDRVLDQKVFGTDATTKTSYGFTGDLMTQKVVLPQGNTTISYFNKLGQKTKTEQVSGIERLATQFIYDPLGQVKQVTNAMNHFTKYEYDLLGRVTKKDASASGVTLFTYDDLGQITQKKDANNRIVNYRYSFNRLVEIIGQDINATFRYERGGRLELMIDGTGNHAFKYGKLGEVVEESKYIPDQRGVDHYFKTKYKYDSWGRLLEMVYPDREKVFYHYNSVGQLVRIVNDSNQEYLSEVKYNHFDQPYYMRYGNRVELKQEFDYVERLRVAQLSSPSLSSLSVVARNVYGYDKNNNVTSMYNNYSQHDRIKVGGTYQKVYTYDKFNRLAKAVGKWDGLVEEHQYNLTMKYNKDHSIAQKMQAHSVYDKNTHQTNSTENALSRDYTYDNALPQVKRIVGRDTSGGRIGQSFEYEPGGNLLTITSNGNIRNVLTYTSRKFQWDANNNITLIDDDGRVQNRYLYDGKGERVRKIISSNSGLSINGGVNAVGTYGTNEIIYPSGYLVYTDNMYTKHYYANSKRIASRIGKSDDVGGFRAENYNTVNVSPHMSPAGRMSTMGVNEPLGINETGVTDTSQMSEAICKNQVEFLLNSLYNTPEKLYCRQQILSIVDKSKTLGSRCIQRDVNGNCMVFELYVTGTNYCKALEQINAQGCVQLTEDGLVIDPETGYVYDPLTGIPLDPITREPIDLGNVTGPINRLELDCYNNFLEFIEYYYDREEKPPGYDLLLQYYYCMTCRLLGCKECYSLPGIRLPGTEGEVIEDWILGESGFYINFCELVIPPIVREDPETPEEPVFPPVVLPPAIGDTWTDNPPPGTNPPLTVDPGDVVTPIWWYHSDHLGSTSYITDLKGKPVQYIEYLPFGEVMVEQSTNNILENVYKFNGKEIDPQTGYYYYGARYYDPGTSIFLSVDPLAEKYPNINPYTYVANNPINAIDPDGRKIIYVIRGNKGNDQVFTYRNGAFYDSKNKIFTPDAKKQSTMYRALQGFKEVLRSKDKTLIAQFRYIEQNKSNNYIEQGKDNSVESLDGLSAIGFSSDTRTTFNFDVTKKTAFEIIAHEFRHILDHNIGNMRDNKRDNTADDPSEIRAVYNENLANEVIGNEPRTTYGKDTIDPELLKNPPNNKQIYNEDKK
ncbi:RHS repeat-associated core domain-containing protein [Myroides sp. WP-1]|uniref:RHS repeat-associated core domain-containing protein n=1 Tax=Myroides sp. WP-1 TaxID=2759944 RepID=UPI0015FCF4EB|nr:RHS repeat-associated core domain-containing protein [Myroides sp. WP-1]MBB1140699.1 hypothetical protein [Myroides sp. WP-1]